MYLYVVSKLSELYVHMVRLLTMWIIVEHALVGLPTQANNASLLHALKLHVYTEYIIHLAMLSNARLIR